MHAFAPLRPQYFRKFSSYIFVILNCFFFFGRRRLKKRSEKTEIARSKRRHRKGGGQAAAKKRSPLRRMWNRGRARSAKVHACGAQLKGEFQEISRECEGARRPKVRACGAQLNREFQEISRECEGCHKRRASRSPRGSLRMLADSGRKTEKTKIGRAAAAVRDGWNKRTKIMKKMERCRIQGK